MASRRQTYTRAAAHLALGGLLGQILGMASHVMLANLLGSEGIGLFGLLGSFYATLFVPIVAGIPAGISGEVARVGGRWSPGVASLLRRTILWLLVASVLVLLAGAYAAGHIRLASWQRVAALVPAQAYLPALMAAGCGVVLRGYFHATRAGRAVVVGSLGEQIMRLVVLGSLFWWLRPTMRQHQLAIVILAMSVSEAFGLLLLWHQYRESKAQALASGEPAAGGHNRSRHPRLRNVLHVAAPASAGRFLMAVSRFIEAGLIPALLVKSGLTFSQAMSEYGTLFGMAAPLLFLPDIFTGAMQDLLVPALTETHLTRPQLARHRIQRSLLLTALIGLGTYLCLHFWGAALANRLYPGTTAGQYLVILAPLTILMALDATLTGILRGLGRPSIPMWTDIFALAGRMLIVIAFVPQHGMQAILWALPVGWAVSVVGNLWFVGWWGLHRRPAEVG